jgi:protein-disulfide isomerase
MHSTIYQGQGSWAREAEPSGTFRNYAKQVGVEMPAYDECMLSAKYAGRIQASYDEGIRVGVSSTPTFLIGDRLYVGGSSSDAIRKAVDSLTAVAPSAP